MLRHILVPATGHATDAGVFATALAACGGAAAHLEFLHARQDPAMAAIGMSGGGMDGGYGVAEMMQSIEEEATLLEAAARAAYARFVLAAGLRPDDAASAGPPSSALVVETGDEAGRLIAHGRTADLLVIGRERGTEAVALGLLQDVLGGTGRPVLIAAATCPASLFDAVVIAWKDTAAAARAVGAAMPCIERAKSVVVLAVDEAGGAPFQVDDDLASCQRLVASLRRHAPRVELRQIVPGADPPAEAMLLAAADAGGTLLVMGGYGHSELRETIFGGFTQRVLRGASIPVLMAH